MKSGTSIHTVSGHCCNAFQGQQSKVKVMTGTNAIMDETSISAVWHRGLRVPEHCKRC